MQLATEPSDLTRDPEGSDDELLTGTDSEQASSEQESSEQDLEVYHDGLDRRGEPANTPQLSGDEMDEVGW